MLLWQCSEMKEKFFFFFLSLCVLANFPAFAQNELSARAGYREGYSRVTLSLNNSTPYSVDKSQKNKLIIRFEKGVSVKDGKIGIETVPNIDNVKVLSQDPLSFSIDIPEQSKTKVFASGARIFIDVYDPPGGAPKKVETPKENIEPPKDIVVAEVTKKEEIVPLKNPTPSAKAVPPAFVLVPEELPRPKPHNTMSEEKLEKALEERLDSVSVSATTSLSLAAFKNFGALWVVMDQKGLHLRPTLNTQNPDDYGHIENVNIPEGSAYKLDVPDSLYLKAHGGGLVWDVILADQEDTRPPVLPLRVKEDDHGHEIQNLLWPLKSARKVIDLKDPITGIVLKIVLVDDSSDFSGAKQDYVDFTALESPVGLVIMPKVDDLSVKVTNKGVMVSRPHGLQLLPEKMMVLNKTSAKQEKQLPKKFSHEQQEDNHEQGENQKQTKNAQTTKLFDFTDWKGSGIEVLNQNKTVILGSLQGQKPQEMAEELLNLAKMNLSYGRGAEAIGFIELANIILPGLDKSPEYLGLRGVARAFDYKSEIALGDLQDERLAPYDEIKLWKSFVLSDLEDWKQAAEVLPKSYDDLFNYPHAIADRLALGLAEVNLRDGRVAPAEDLLAYVEQNSEHLPPSMQAAYNYLRGEAYRQRGKTEETIKLWEELKKSSDDLYRVKASLALTRLLSENGKISTKEEINSLEHLRYQWRGDELEAQVNYWLGRAYFANKDYAKGLNIMRDAASVAVDTALGRRIASEMSDLFVNLMKADKTSGKDALDAFTIYQQFTELTPPGAQGDELVQNLSEQLVKADMLGRAADLLKKQVEHRLSGANKVRVGIQLAAIDLLDKHPTDAVAVLSNIRKDLSLIEDNALRNKYARNIALLTAKALSQSGQSVKALKLLDEMQDDGKDVRRLRADIAWKEGYWDEAAEAINQILIDDNIDPRGNLTDAQADMILNRAIALNLSNDRVALSGMRQKYNDLMMRHKKKAKPFELITRSGDKSVLADRDTLMGIVSEVDLFGDFLEAYRKEGEVKE